MKLTIRRFVACPFSATIDFAEEALAESPEIEVSPVEGLGERVDVASVVVEDKSDTVRKHDALQIAWRPQHRGLYPDLRGVLTVRPEHRGSDLILAAEYRPPFGLPGRAFDAVVGRFLAHRTLHRFLEHLGARIEERWRS